MGIGWGKGRRPVRTDEKIRLVYHEDDCVSVPSEKGCGWVTDDGCDVSDGAWVVVVKLLNQQQYATVSDTEGTRTQAMRAVGIAFVDWEIVGEPPHRTARRERLRALEDALPPDPMTLLGLYIQVASAGADPREGQTAPFLNEVDHKETST